MTRFHFLISCLVASGAALSALPLWGQESTFEDYRRQIAESQKRDTQRYEDWTRQRDQRYGEWLAPADKNGRIGPPAPNDRGFEFRDPIVTPGNYAIRLPLGLGNLRVNVPPSAQPQPPGWNSRVYGDVQSLAQRMKVQLRDIHAELYHLGQPELQAQAGKIFQQCAELEAAAAARRSDKELQQQFHDFDELWHPFSHRVARQQELSANLRQRTAAVNEIETSLHQLLTIAPAAPYDRVLVAALSHQLAEVTGHLLEDVKIEAQQEYGLRAIQAGAARVKQQAADLAAAVQQNAPYTSVIDEYEEFDRAWHRLEERAQGSPEIDTHLRRVSRQVRQIDRQLHEALLVSTPLANDRQQALQLSAAIAKTADHLASDLDADIGRGNRREVVTDCQAFAAAAHNLHQTQSQGADGRAADESWRQFLLAWNRLTAQLKMLSGDRFEHSQEMAQQLQADIKRLENHFQGERGRSG